MLTISNFQQKATRMSHHVLINIVVVVFSKSRNEVTIDFLPKHHCLFDRNAIVYLTGATVWQHYDDGQMTSHIKRNWKPGIEVDWRGPHGLFLHQTNKVASFNKSTVLMNHAQRLAYRQTLGVRSPLDTLWSWYFLSRTQGVLHHNFY